MKSKGFTLVELLAIIVILGLIALAAIPNISKQVEKSEEQEQTVLNKKIENAAKLYAAKYYSKEIVNCSSSSNPCAEFLLNDLEEDGLLSLNNNQCTTVRIENDPTDQDYKIKIYLKSSKIHFDYENIDNDNGVSDCHTDVS